MPEDSFDANDQLNNSANQINNSHDKLGSTLNLINEEIKSDLKRNSQVPKVKEIRTLGQTEVLYRE
jgi:hypothetical protein